MSDGCLLRRIGWRSNVEGQVDTKRDGCGTRLCLPKELWSSDGFLRGNNRRWWRVVLIEELGSQGEEDLFPPVARYFQPDHVNGQF